jgi:hypothetical protein
MVLQSGKVYTKKVCAGSKRSPRLSLSLREFNFTHTALTVFTGRQFKICALAKFGTTFSLVTPDNLLSFSYHH